MTALDLNLVTELLLYYSLVHFIRSQARIKFLWKQNFQIHLQIGSSENSACVLWVALSRVGKLLGCSGAISLHLHFRVLSGINRFQTNETGFETGFQSKVLKKFRTPRLKPVSDS